MSITNAQHLAFAVNEARRFIAVAEKVQASVTHQFGTEHHHYNTSPKDTGATRRASMDLTRALAELRRPTR
jgi:hypothetical protein